MSQLPEERIKRLALEGGASVVGIASVSQINQYVPPEHRPDDILGRARSVVVVGSPRYTSGTWLTAHTEVLHRARVAISARDSLALNIARFIEREYSHPSILYNSQMRDTGFNPALSLKVCAEMAGLGTRSMAGGIILNEQYGLLNFAATITTMELKTDSPLAEPVCPHPACVSLWEREQATPCMEVCGAIEGRIENGRLKEVVYYRQLCAIRCQTTMNTAYLRLLPEIVAEEDPLKRRYLAIGQARMYAEDPPGRGVWGRCIECMRVCPVNRRAIKLTGGV
jgi:epoxyqueuosine reductase QueG